MKKKLIIFIICVFTLSGWAQIGSSIALEAKLGVVFYDENLADMEEISYGLAIHTSLFDQLSTGLLYKTSTASRDILIPGSSINVNTHWQIYQVHFTYQLLNLSESFYISPTIGLGVIHLTTPAMTADLGALGNANIPARSSTHFITSPGLKFRITIFDRLSVTFLPGLHLFSTSEKRYLNYFIEGGLQIAIR